jgi:hypothetical protein
MQSACAVLYWQLWPVRLYRNFLIISKNGTIFRKKGIKHMFWFFLTSFVWNISHSKNNSVRYYYKCLLVFIQSTRYSCQWLMKLEFSRQFFKKSSNVKFHENPSSGNWAFLSGKTDGRTDGWTDRHDDANSRFRSSANAPKLYHQIDGKHVQVKSTRILFTHQRMHYLLNLERFKILH